MPQSHQNKQSSLRSLRLVSLLLSQIISSGPTHYSLIKYHISNLELTLMNRLVAMLQEVHKRHVAILSLSVNNVRIKEGG